jgi:tetratricopeptide (TPR) repeat protein
MAPDLGSTTTLKEAERKAREYRWAEAAESYRQALRSRPRSNRFVAETWEKVGFCYVRASRQAEDLGEFKSLRKRAGEAYRKAGELFGREDDSNRGRKARCYAIAEYANSWLASSVAERKSMLDKCCTNGTTALEAFEKAGDKASYGETCNNLQLCLFDYLNIASSAQEKRVIAQRGIDYGEKAISALTKRKEKSELLVAYSLASLQNWYAANISEQEAESRELTQRSLDYSEKALALSEEAKDPYSAAMSRWAATFCSLFFTGEIESSLKHAEEMRQLGSTTRDKYLKGVALYLLAFVT